MAELPPEVMRRICELAVAESVITQSQADANIERAVAVASQSKQK